MGVGQLLEAPWEKDIRPLPPGKTLLPTMGPLSLLLDILPAVNGVVLYHAAKPPSGIRASSDFPHQVPPFMAGSSPIPT